jgi:hypothetical protein
MKYLKIITIIFVGGLLFQAYGYVNLMVSYKYEVDLMETNIETDETLSKVEKKNRLSEVELKKKEIISQQNRIKILFWIFLFGSILLLYLLYHKRK